jgi:hypothetical protein
MKEKKRENLLRNLHRRRKNFLFIYEVIVNHKKRKLSANHYSPAAKIVINDDNNHHMYNVGMLPVLEIVLAQQMPGEEKAEEGAAHKIVVILLHLSFINAGLDWLVERKKCPRLHAPHKFGYTRKHRRRWAGGKGCRVTVFVFESAGMVTRQVYRQVYRRRSTSEITGSPGRPIMSLHSSRFPNTHDRHECLRIQ